MAPLLLARLRAGSGVSVGGAGVSGAAVRRYTGSSGRWDLAEPPGGHHRLRAVPGAALHRCRGVPQPRHLPPLALPCRALSPHRAPLGLHRLRPRLHQPRRRLRRLRPRLPRVPPRRLLLLAAVLGRELAERIRSCLQEGGVFSRFGAQRETLQQFVANDLSPIQVFHYGRFEDAAGEQLSQGQSVSLEINAERRKLNSRLHSAGHLLDSCMTNLGLHLEPGKGYHFPDGPFVEYKGVVPPDELPDKKIELEKEANELVSIGSKG